MHPTRDLPASAIASPLLKNLHWAALAWAACFEVAWGVARLAGML